MRRCYLVRHAQTAWNGENRLQGHSDPPLSPLGREQAERLAAYFASRTVHRLFTSDLQRSLQTAQVIAEASGNRLSPIIEPDLAEMHLGSWEGLTPEEIDARFQSAYQLWQARPSSVAIPGAEPVEAFRRRVRGAFSRILASDEEGEAVVVTHGGVIAAWLADVLGVGYDALLRRLRLDNAGVTALGFGAGLPQVLWINATAHLDGIAADRVTDAARPVSCGPSASSCA